MVEPELRKRMDKDIPGRERMCQGVEERNHGACMERFSLTRRGVVGDSWKCRLGSALGMPKMPGSGIWIL